ncbi:major facilitator superfamily domain-containing protein [Xylariales sp. PMI_506]|nr:major facilitator superfamily domain-containing protein [Xylariales sp. PMI_506]
MANLSDPEKAADNNVVSIGSDFEAPSLTDKAAEKRLVWKTDVILMPALAMAYLTHTLDRANLGNAKTDTFQADLGLVGNQFSLLLILFYIPYALMNVPFTLLSKRFNPAVVIPSIMTIWGSMAMAAAGTKNFGGILAVRIIMGAVEAAFFPCAIFYCSTFYGKELSFRASVFGMMGFIAGAISGLIAWSVFQWHKSLHGWQYLFLIEGSMTVGVGLILFLVLPHSVEKSRWFTEEEKEIARRRREEDSQLLGPLLNHVPQKDEDKNFRWSDARKECKDWTTWVFTLMPLFCNIFTYIHPLTFSQTIVKRIAINTSKANLYTVGPNLTAAAVQLTTTWLSDRFQQRATIACGTLFVSFIAWILLATLDLVNNVQVGYFLTYLLTFGTFTPGILIPVWVASNTTTTTGRAFRLGLNFMAQNLAGIISSAVFRDQDAPVYKPALITVACFQAAFMVVCLGLREHFRRLNKKLDSGELVHISGGKERPEYRYAL